MDEPCRVLKIPSHSQLVNYIMDNWYLTTLFYLQTTCCNLLSYCVNTKLYSIVNHKMPCQPCIIKVQKSSVKIFCFILSINQSPCLLSILLEPVLLLVPFYWCLNPLICKVLHITHDFQIFHHLDSNTNPGKISFVFF